MTGQKGILLEALEAEGEAGLMGHDVPGLGAESKRMQKKPWLGCRQGEVALQDPAPQILLPWQGCGATQPAPSPVGGEGEDFPSRWEPRCVPRAAGEEGWELQRAWDMGFSSAAWLRAPACHPAVAKELSSGCKNALGRKGKTGSEPNDASAAGGYGHFHSRPCCGAAPDPTTWEGACCGRRPASAPCEVTVGKSTGGCRQQRAG